MREGVPEGRRLQGKAGRLGSSAGVEWLLSRAEVSAEHRDPAWPPGVG